MVFVSKAEFKYYVVITILVSLGGPEDIRN